MPPPKAAQSVPLSLFDTQSKAYFRRQLLAWYHREKRTLPWRSESDQPGNPYHVFVSEAMLQQTQVATVIAYFHRFIKRFPTVKHLAQASEQEVLKLWEGLGYYRRARNLHRAAQMIMDEFGGNVPQTVESLLKLPGIGRYTAGAIASIAHQRPAPILDGNVIRVLSRYTAFEEPTDSTSGQQQLWASAEHLVKGKSPADFNQAMMELGALVCTPKSPSCLVCPLRNQCRANQSNVPEKYPQLTKKIKPRQVHHHVIAIHRRGKHIIRQRPDDGLWSSMWELPTLELNDKLAINNHASWNGATDIGHPTQVAADLCKHVEQTFGLKLTQVVELKVFKHQTTHRTIAFHLWTAEVTTGRLKPTSGQWVQLQHTLDFPFSNPQRTIIKILLSHFQGTG